MKQTSDNYQTQMANQCRGCSHMKIILESGETTYTFEDDIISSAVKSSDVDPLTRRTPKENFDFSIFDIDGDYNPSNPSGKWNALEENANITVYFGFEVSPGVIEWLAPDYFLLSAKPTYANAVASFKSCSKLTRLTNRYYKGTYGNKTLYEMAEAVLQDVGISAGGYWIDSSLQSITTDAPLPVTTHLNALQLIAHAGLCTLRTINGVITIQKFNVSSEPSPFVMGLDSVAFGGDVLSKIEILYKVQAYKYSYTVDVEASKLLEVRIDVSGDTPCHIEYASSTEQTITVTDGATISNLNAYSCAADFVLSGEGTYAVTVMGKKISNASDMAEATVSLNVNGSTDTEKNQLITTTAQQSALIYHVANYLQFRMTHSVKYRGNPEIEALDDFFLETGLGTYIQALVLTHSINFKGAISGTLTLKSLSNISDVYLYEFGGTVVSDVNDERISLISLTDYQSEYSAEDMDEFITEVLNNG